MGTALPGIVLAAVIALPAAPAGATDAGARSIVGDLGVEEPARVVTVAHSTGGALEIDVTAVSGRRQAISEVTAGLADPSVTSVELDSRVRIAEGGDPNSGQQWGIDAVRAPTAWTMTRGRGVRVAVVDTGVDAAHEDLDGRVLPGVDLTGGQISTATPDPNGHGTHVAGIIAAADNQVGGIGVAPQAEVLPVRVLDAQGAGYASDVAEGIVWAVDHGAQVVNLSLGGPVPSDAQRAAVQYATGRGVLVVAAAGNSGTDAAVEYPAAFPEVMAVAATTPEQEVATFSTRGAYVDVSAPGTMILSSVPGGGYAYRSGSSMAAPFAAGVAALVRALAPGDDDIAGLLSATATDIDTPGFDQAAGAGLICATCALEAFLGHPLPGTRPVPAAAPVISPEIPRRRVTIRARPGERLVLRAPPELAQCTWSVRAAVATWRGLAARRCHLHVGRVRKSMDGARYRVSGTIRGDPVRVLLRVTIVGA